MASVGAGELHLTPATHAAPAVLELPPPAPVTPEPSDCLASDQPCLGLLDLPEPLHDAILSLLGLGDLATASCASSEFHGLCQRALASKREFVGSTDLRLLARQHNFLLLGAHPSCGHHSNDPSYGASHASGSKTPDTAVADASAIGACSSGGGRGGAARAERQRLRVLGYVPAALHYASERCRSLQRVHLELPPPPVPLNAAADAVAAAAAGEPWGQPRGWQGGAGAGDSECPPVDGYLVKLLAQSCPGLLSLRLVNITNNTTLNRLVRPNDSCLAVLARSCPLLQELVIGHQGGEECMFTPSAPYYLEEVSDLGLRAVAQSCTQLRRLVLLRCSRVGDGGLALVAQMCRQLTALTLHDCPGISDRALMAVGERCTQLRSLDCTVARRAGGLLFVGEDAEQLGFRALFTIAANCPLLEELRISEEGLEAPVVDDDCILCLAQGCPRLRRLALRHCGAVTDAAVRAVATRCKLLQELVLEHTAVGDTGVLHAARALPLLRALTLTNYTSSLGHLSFLPDGPRPIRGVSDAALQHICEHMTRLRSLAITGSRRVTDAGLLRLAASPALARRLTALTLNHTGATDASVRAALGQCRQLRALSLRGLLFSADATLDCIAASCRHITSLDLRHCSTLSDAGLSHAAQLPTLRTLHLSFCVRITDAGLCLLAGRPAAATSGFGVHGCNGSGAAGGASAGPAGCLFGGGRCGASGSMVFGWAPGPPLNLGQNPASQEVTGPGSSGGSGAALSIGSRRVAGPRAILARASMLQELELYQVQQVTHHGIWALAEACPELQHVNIGKCRQVRADSLRPLLDRRPLRLSVCHYLDS